MSVGVLLASAVLDKAEALFTGLCAHALVVAGGLPAVGAVWREPFVESHEVHGRRLREIHQSVAPEPTQAPARMRALSVAVGPVTGSPEVAEGDGGVTVGIPW